LVTLATPHPKRMFLNVGIQRRLTYPAILLYSSTYFLIKTRKIDYLILTFSISKLNHLAHPRTFLKHHLPNTLACVYIVVRIYIYIMLCYILTYFSFPRCRIFFFFVWSTVFLTICDWRAVLLRPLRSDLSTTNYVFQTGKPWKNYASDSNTTPLGPKIKITRIVLFTEYIRDSQFRIYCWNSLFLLNPVLISLRVLLFTSNT